MWAGPTGIELTSGETHVTAQMMFLPCVRPGEKMQHRGISGPWIDVDKVLDSYENWHDKTQWPHRKDGDNTQHKEKADDPRTKAGIVGQFCRAFDVPTAIERFELPYTKVR